jgi:very-short-patch-repair endonuclease
MQHISQIFLNFLEDSVDIPEYRPPRWESHIERELWEALRYIGISAETQVPIGNFRIDMLVSSRRNSNKAIIECDGAEFHHKIIDEFRDDELLDTIKLPIAHVYGKEIFKSPERCALFITERWFPEHMDSLGYISALERAYEDETTHVDGCSGFFPVGLVRPIFGDLYPSYTDIKFRSFVRYITGNIDDYDFSNENERKEYSSLRAELQRKGIFESKLPPQELARVYVKIYPGYDETTRNSELENLESFLDRLRSRNNSSSEINSS